ncbi:PEP-CTERM sorting domain-containing protein [Adhaeretor mobilis]|uniref:Ice-binding protein C-terminal domain-containing protein n=1 Tax=Adhaeretor mobilis TaxID=1930276 RepID=A0A517MY08_9BACT|nr:PEP-CTERM sorting domain-containing protein [Adhaeretor mobilis]QDS99759.1 hypothetical protein HG15A2_30890 [Adhaeretor mobilis]
MIRNTLFIFGAVLATVVMAVPASAATLVQSFENNDLTSPTTVSTLGDVVSSAFSATGVTDGAASYEVTPVEATQGAGAKFMLKINLLSNPAIIPALQANPIIQFDVTIPVDDDPSDAHDGTKAVVVANSEMGGFVGYYGGATNDFTFGAGSTTYEYTFSPAVIAGLANPANSYSEITLGFNSQPGVQPTGYFDNIRIPTAPVPEPASLLLLSLAGVGCLSMGRRRG